MEKDSLLSEKVQDDLDRQLFHLRTLYDVSHELLGLSDIQDILKSFLLMTMGNFGAIQGFIMAQDSISRERTYFEPVGFYESDHLLLEQVASQVLVKARPEGVEMLRDILRDMKPSMPEMVCVTAFKVDEHCSGLMGLGKKLIDNEYTDDDKELLATLVNNLVVSLKNARYSEALKNALEEVRTLNSAKDKAINHLSHELRTPLAILEGTLRRLEARIAPLSVKNCNPVFEMAYRNLNRIRGIQDEVEDIMENSQSQIHGFLSTLLAQCADELETWIAEQAGDSPLIEKMRRRIDELFGAPKEIRSEKINLDQAIRGRINELGPVFSHRQVEIITRVESVPPVLIPREVFEKVIDGLIRNAIENTPDEGRIEIEVRKSGNGPAVQIHDYGVGITKEHQSRIFEGFFPTQDTMRYASKKPFYFNAGGKGADLLRTKIFSERFNFRIEMISSRCKFIPQTSDECPGRISECSFCKTVEDCHQSGGTTFQVSFPL